MKKKIIYSFLFVLCLLFIFSSTSLANGIKIYFSSGGKSNVDMETVTSNVYTILYTFGIILAVCILVTIAISYMVATPNKKAQLKERLIYYFAGVIFLVGGLAFLRIYEKTANDIGAMVGSTNGSSGYTNSDGDYVYFDPVAQSLKEATDLPLSEVKKMDYESLSEYANSLKQDIEDFEKMIDEQEHGATSGQNEMLQRAKDRFEYVTNLLDDYSAGVNSSSGTNKSDISSPEFSLFN